MINLNIKLCKQNLTYSITERFFSNFYLFIDFPTGGNKKTTFYLDYNIYYADNEQYPWGRGDWESDIKGDGKNESKEDKRHMKQ